MTQNDKRCLVESLPGFVALWDFAEKDKKGRFDAVTAVDRLDFVSDYSLVPGNLLYDYWGRGKPAGERDIPWFDRGPLGGSVFFDAALAFSDNKEMYYYLKIPREQIHNTPLDIKGNKPLTMIAWVIRHKDKSRHFISGIWHEGTDLRDCVLVEEGRRQFALFGGLAANPGAVGGHISDTGKGSFGDLYARHIAVTKEIIPPVDLSAGEMPDANEWQCLSMTFDPRSGEVSTGLNGVFTEHWIDNPRNSPVYRHHMVAGEEYNPPESYFRREGEEIKGIKANPYWFGRSIYAPASIERGAPFTIGRAVSSFLDAGFTGLVGGVALFDSCLSRDDIRRLSSIDFRKG